MASTISIREQLENELSKKLEPFVEECHRRGYPVKNLRVLESVPGVHNSFFIKVEVNWSKTWIDAIRTLFPILHESTPEEVHNVIWGIVPELSSVPLHKVRPVTRRKKSKHVLAAS
jgi:hypothetical protein